VDAFIFALLWARYIEPFGKLQHHIGGKVSGSSSRLQRANELAGNSRPRRVRKHQLSMSGPEWQDMQLAFLPPDQPPEQKPACRGGEAICPGSSRGQTDPGQSRQPDLVAAAIVADAGRDIDCHQTRIGLGRHDHARAAGRMSAVMIQDRGDRDIFPVRQLHQIGRIDAERAGDPIEPPTDTVLVPVSRRPMVCGVVGGSHRSATSCRVSFLARRTSRIRVIIRISS
jgi:hypothetical protein